MRGGALPPALLFVALVFALAFVPRRAVLPALVIAGLVALAAVFVPLPHSWTEVLFAGCWVSIILTSALVHLPSRLGLYPALLVAGNAGLWAGATIAVAGAPVDLARALPVVLLVLPSRWLIGRRAGVAVKVAASWLIAVAILAATLPIVPTPGYVADHME